MSADSKQHSRLPITSLAEAQGYIEHLEEQLEAAQKALKQIVGMYEFEQVAADSWEDSGGHVGIARHDRAVLQGLGMARDIAVEALSNPASEPEAS